MSTVTKTGTTEEPYTLDKYKTDAENNLIAQRERKNQIADINYQKLMKYLPDRQRANGTAGMAGLSESAALAAAADYQNAVSAAESEYNEAHTELLNNYRLEKEAEQDELYNEIMTKIDSGEFNTTEELQNYLNGDGTEENPGLMSGLSEQQRQLIKGKMDFYAASPEQKKIEAEKASTAKAQEYHQKMDKAGIKVNGDVTVSGMHNDGNGQNFTANFFGEKCYVQIKEKVQAPEGSGDVPNGQLFSKEGIVYYKNNNGAVFEIEGVGNDKTNGDFAKLKKILETGKSD